MAQRSVFVSLGWTFRDYAKRVWDNSGEDNVLFLAGGIAFNIILAALPFLLLLVTGVGSLIHFYSIGYMKGDPLFARFFAYLNLFAASMLILVLADNFLLTFLGWEGVGLCSYLLISFWYQRNSAAVAGKKAFVTNRVGDVGFLIAMFLIIATYGTLRNSP